MQAQTLVQMKHVRKEFPGVTALSDMSFDIRAGEVHVLLGENGAGKSTLMKILSGVHKPTSGSVVIDGKEYKSLTPHDADRLGIRVIYQELSVIPTLSIRENLFVGNLPVKKRGFLHTVDYAEMQRRAEGLLEKVGLHRDARTPVEDLSISEKQQVEIAKALAVDSRVIIMDEPTASLTHEEVRHLFAVIRALKAQGRGIVFISHKLPEILEIGDRVTVLKDGANVGTKQITDVTADDLVTMMVGRQIRKNYQNESAPDGFEQEEVLFEVKGLSRRDGKARDVSFRLHKGEILGFAGLVGAGRSELMDAVFGAAPKQSGQILLHGKEIRTKRPYQAIRNGLAMVTENRRETGFFHNFDIKQNISLLPFVKTARGGGTLGLIDRRFEKRCAEQQRKALRIKCASVNQPVTEISGGNQQKVILGRWLAAQSEILIFDEPTKGIDVGSKAEIYALMRELADSGKGVLVVSSELPELLAVCDTIAVYREGEIVRVFPHSAATEENIVLAATAGDTE